jgi:hypothetical protein
MDDAARRSDAIDLSSERLRVASEIARTFEWLAITGVFERAIVASVAAFEACETSTIPPSALIRSMAARPSSERPPCASDSYCFVTGSWNGREESEKSLCARWFRAKTRTPAL